MTDEKIKLIVGSLLHDIGKVIYRQGDDRRNHSKSGYDYLKSEAGLKDRAVLDCVRFHHGAALKDAQIEKDDLSYIVYLADNIAAAADRREKEAEDKGFECSVPLQSIFNILNGNHEEMYYMPGDMDPSRAVNYPQSEKIAFSEAFYSQIKQRITGNLKGMEWSAEYVNSLLAVMEANLTYVPSSTAKGELADISLFDHVKLTAAVASCIHEYLRDNGINDYREYLFLKSGAFYRREVFLMCSMDVSGIQDFIYTIASKNALRTLRARSFYLEIMMEHIIDCLLEKLQLSRANLIYSGGGHCYLLLPNTPGTKKAVDDYLREINRWFTKYFANALYIAGACVPCSSENLRNIPAGSYSDIYREMGRLISEKKMHRYTADEIRRLNDSQISDYTRECKVCRMIGETDENGVCPICSKMEKLSKNVLHSDFFTVLAEGAGEGLPLPGNYILVSDSEERVRQRMETDNYFVRAYSKNELYTGRHISTKLWVGDYTTGQTFEEFADDANGIKRIGILRADVDNLGQAFVSGFDNEKNGNRYVTLTRTAVLSRQLSVFFKFHINTLLKNGIYGIEGDKGRGPRKATIIYSGGDDVFIAGAWDDVIELAVDLRRSFRRYTQGTLTLSAGIGIYDAGYPISAIAVETGDMEEESKKLSGKNAVTIFEDGRFHVDGGEEMSDGTWHWEEFECGVIEEKYRTLQTFLQSSEDRGMAFMYHLLELIRCRDEKINFARLVYLLSRLEPPEEGARKKSYRAFAEKMYGWVRSERDCRQLKSAINLYAYRNREKGGNQSVD